MRPAAEWREAPYPGARPGFSYVQIDEVVFVLNEATGTVDGIALDTWLADRGEATMSEREPVLAYGSNACPSKLVTMRDRDGLKGAVVMTTCNLEGLAAAWCTGTRGDGATVATLVEAAGSEPHFVWWVAPEQWAALDKCEGAPTVYELLPVSGTIRSADGTAVDDVQAYVGASVRRQPRRDDDGKPVLVRDLPPEIVNPVRP